MFNFPTPAILNAEVTDPDGTIWYCSNVTGPIWRIKRIPAAAIEIPQIFATHALMLAAGLNKGEIGVITTDTDPLKNGKYTCIKDAATVAADFLKDPTPATFEATTYASLVLMLAGSVTLKAGQSALIASASSESGLYTALKNTPALVTDFIKTGKSDADVSTVQFKTGEHVDHIELMKGSTTEDVQLFSAVPLAAHELTFTLAKPLEIVAGKSAHIHIEKTGTAGFMAGLFTCVVALTGYNAHGYGGGTGVANADKKFMVTLDPDKVTLKVKFQETSLEATLITDLKIRVLEGGMVMEIPTVAAVKEWIRKGNVGGFNLLGFYDDVAALSAVVGKTDKDYVFIKENDQIYRWDTSLSTPAWKIFGYEHHQQHIFDTLAKMLVATNVESGDICMVLRDTTSTKNGWYRALINNANVIADYEKYSISAADIVTKIGGTSMTLHALLTTWESNTMIVRGSIDQVSDITKVGIYYGPKTVANVGILDAPRDGPGMIMASVDGAGNFGYFFLGSDQILRTGSKPVGGAVAWKAAGAGSFIPIADADLDMQHHAIVKLKDPRTGTIGADDAVNKHSMDEALASRSLYQGAYAPGKNLPDLVVMSDSSFAAPVAGESVSSPSATAPSAAATNINIWYRPDASVFGPTYPVNIAADKIVTIILSNGQRINSTIHSGDYLTQAAVQQEFTNNLVNMVKGIVSVHWFKTGAANLPWIGIETIAPVYCTGVEFEGESAGASGGLSSGDPGTGNVIGNSYNWVITTVDPDQPESAIPGIPGIRVGEKLYNGDVLQWSTAANGFELFRSGIMTKAFANENYWSTTADNMKWQNIVYKSGAVVLSKRAFYQATRDINRGEPEPGTLAAASLWQLLNEDSGSVVFFGQGDYDVTHTTGDHNWGMPDGTYPDDGAGHTLQPKNKDVYLDTVKGSITTFVVVSYPPVFVVSGICDTTTNTNYGDLSQGPSTGHEDVMNFMIDGDATMADIDGFYVFDNTLPTNLAITRGMLAGNVMGPGRTLVIWTGDKNAENHGWVVIREDASANPHFWSSATPNPTAVPDNITATTKVNNFFGNALIGEIIMFPSITPPDRFMLCDGSTFDEVLFPEVFRILGDSNILPDLTEQFVRGASTDAQIDLAKKQDSTKHPNTPFETATDGQHGHDFQLNNQPYDHSHGDSSSAATGDSSGRFRALAYDVMYHADPIVNHKHAITGGGDPETAPVHVYMAYMIRMNNG